MHELAISSEDKYEAGKFEKGTGLNENMTSHQMTTKDEQSGTSRGSVM